MGGVACDELVACDEISLPLVVSDDSKDETLLEEDEDAADEADVTPDVAADTTDPACFNLRAAQFDMTFVDSDSSDIAPNATNVPLDERLEGLERTPDATDDTGDVACDKTSEATAAISAYS